MMADPLLQHPAPDFAEMVRVLKGEQRPRRVHLVELYLDAEVMRVIVERYLGQSWVPRSEGWLPLTAEARAQEAQYYKQLITLYYRLGYDYVPVDNWGNWAYHPARLVRQTADTAELSRGERSWVEEGGQGRATGGQVLGVNVLPEWCANQGFLRGVKQGAKGGIDLKQVLASVGYGNPDRRGGQERR